MILIALSRRVGIASQTLVKIALTSSQTPAQSPLNAIPKIFTIDLILSRTTLKNKCYSIPSLFYHIKYCHTILFPERLEPVNEWINDIVLNVVESILENQAHIFEHNADHLNDECDDCTTFRMVLERLSANSASFGSSFSKKAIAFSVLSESIILSNMVVMLETSGFRSGNSFAPSSDIKNRDIVLHG